MLSVVLEPYNAVYPLSKKFIRAYMPGSLFFEALEEDPSAEELVITNPDVTPKAMDDIFDYTYWIEPLHHNPDLILAYRYLNIPWLLYYVDPLYDLIPNHWDILDPKNREVWEEAIKTDHELIVGYYLVKGWVPTNADFVTAASNGAIKVVRLLLGDERVNPSNQHNRAIRWAAINGHLEVVRLLLGDARVNPADQHNEAIRGAAANGHLEVVRLLVGDKRVNPTAISNAAIRGAVAKGHLDVVRLLDMDPRVQAVGGY